MFAKRLLAAVGLVPVVAAVAVAQPSFAPPPPRTLTGATAPAPAPVPPSSSLFAGPQQAVAKSDPFRPVPSLPTLPALPTDLDDTLSGKSDSPLPLPGIPTAVPNPVPGAVYSPWVGDQFAGGCCGPVGANGPTTFEPYFRTGPNLLTGGGTMTAVAKTFGWTFQAGTRSLLFDPASDAAWVIDINIGHTVNEGRGLSRPVAINRDAVKFGGPGFPGSTTFDAGVTGFRRTSFNFGIGRDYWHNGPGGVSPENQFGNLRTGWDVGGRWGTGSVDFEPGLEPDGYRRRQKVYHALYLGAQATWEQPMGAWTPFVGMRAEWSYNWTNFLPPNDGDFRDMNLMLTVGFRF